ncbi:MAG: GGDEF domain-containing protein [Hylemonella sp.]|nr:GGDEF domain-containing protein [Hylemonella sp.]
MIALRQLLSLWLARLEAGCLIDLLSARGHALMLSRQRLAACVTRIRLVTVAFSVLTLAWIPLDAWTLSFDQWSTLAFWRVLAACVFLALALMPALEPSPFRTRVLLGVMLAMPLMIYAVSQYLFAGHVPQGPAAMNMRLYQALPWIVLAGLSIFPLVALEGLALAGLITGTVTSVNLLWMPSAPLANLAMLLVMLLVSGVYLLACAIQLHYMMALLRRAGHDPLTDALVRRSGAEVLELHYQLATELDQPLSVLFLDADNFKALNDTYGHAAGDQALQQLVHRLHAVLRQGDLVIRWGGEEFVVLLVNTPLNGAHTVLHHLLRDWLGKRPDGKPLTASIGLAERQSDTTSDWQHLVELADQRMYAAKSAGKACCVGRSGIVQPHRRPVPAGLPEPRCDSQPDSVFPRWA